MTAERPSWPRTCREVAALLAELATRLEPPFAEELGPVQELGRRLAVANLGTARDTLETAAATWRPGSPG
jgi:hypothetical protein